MLRDLPCALHFTGQVLEYSVSTKLITQRSPYGNGICIAAISQGAAALALLQLAIDWPMANSLTASQKHHALKKILYRSSVVNFMKYCGLKYFMKYSNNHEIFNTLNWNIHCACSGAGTNLKVGQMSSAKRRLVCRAQPLHFLGSAYMYPTISRFLERSRDGQYIWLVNCLSHGAPVPRERGERHSLSVFRGGTPYSLAQVALVGGLAENGRLTM